MSSKKSNIIIIVYSIILIGLLLGFGNMYGFVGDWLYQHAVIPDYFRQMFYETKTLIPNFAFNLGAGQNIFNFSYYGLMSPFVLISYFLPFVKMPIFISLMSILIFISSGLLMNKFLRLNEFDDKLSLIISLIFLTLSPLTYHFHHHIMFVWYFPFLILALIGTDKFLKENKSFLLMISIFLVLLTNYYYGVASILVVGIYGVYKIINNSKSIKEFIKKLLPFIIRIIIPILLACFILMPTINAILTTTRTSENAINIKDLFLFKINSSMYYSFGMGLSFIFILAIVGNIIQKKKSIAEYFLNIVLLALIFIPIILYVLNGFLYVRGKVLIPFVLLYIFNLANFIKNLTENKIEIKKLIIVSSLVALITILVDHKNHYALIFIADVIITFITIKCYLKYKNNKIILIPVLIIILISSIINNYHYDYVTIKEYQELEKHNNGNNNLLRKINDNSLYRTYIDEDLQENVNKVVNNTYSTTLYSSSFNSLYADFYHQEIGNNIPYRNVFVTTGSNNSLFYTFMGAKYIISKNDKMLNYQKIREENDYSLYYNEDAYPIVYATNNYGSIDDYKKLHFPYNVEFLMSRPVVNEKQNKKYNSSIKKLNLDIKNTYDLKINNDKSFVFKLEEPIKNKFLMIDFDIGNTKSCIQKDLEITINGVENKLTCKSWFYYNQNDHFKYIISNNSSIDELKIKITPGEYHIKNINVYTMDNNLPKYNEIDNLQIDKAKSTIQGEVNLNDSSYIITSFPYDEGFEVLVDGKKVKKEIVNTAFLGFKINKGKHQIKIIYNSPGYKLGIIISLIGLGMFMIIIIREKMIVKK